MYVIEFSFKQYNFSTDLWSYHILKLTLDEFLKSFNKFCANEVPFTATPRKTKVFYLFLSWSDTDRTLLVVSVDQTAAVFWNQPGITAEGWSSAVDLEVIICFSRPHVDCITRCDLRLEECAFLIEFCVSSRIESGLSFCCIAYFISC